MTDDPRRPGQPSVWTGASEDFLRWSPREHHRGDELPRLGDVVLTDRIGSGGMGIVFAGYHRTMRAEVAVKVLPPALGEDVHNRVQRFRREADLASRLDSEHLVAVHDVGFDAATNCLYIVMERVHGVSADRWLRTLTAGDGAARPAEESEALRVCLAACRGLEEAHRAGVVHRDVKPPNLLVPVGADGTAHLDWTKLADLGLARELAGGDELTVSRMPLGSPGYVAPEQAMDARSVGPSADVFGLGATLYALLAGRAPFAADTPLQSLVLSASGRYPDLPSLRPGVSSAIEAVVDRCLQRSPTDRYPDARELRRALEWVLRNRSPGWRPGPRPPAPPVPEPWEAVASVPENEVHHRGTESTEGTTGTEAVRDDGRPGAVVPPVEERERRLAGGIPPRGLRASVVKRPRRRARRRSVVSEALATLLALAAIAFVAWVWFRDPASRPF